MYLSKNYTMSNYKTKKDEISGIVSEPMVAYNANFLPKFSSSILYGNQVKVPEYQLVSLEKMKLLKTGLSKINLEKLKARASLDYDKLAKALSVTRATLINAKGDEKYSSTVSERILALSDLYSYGYKVFEDELKFNNWMFTINQALGNKIPFDIVDNQFGREEIKNILGRIEYGVYS